MKTMQERAAEAMAVPRDVPSPCISLCRMRESDGLCEGCWRTLDEIANWAQMGDAQKREVWAELAQRSNFHVKGIDA
jgi:predicted Fe-S protein YdhL (DUF1289 family)